MVKANRERSNRNRFYLDPRAFAERDAKAGAYIDLWAWTQEPLFASADIDVVHHNYRDGKVWFINRQQQDPRFYYHFYVVFDYDISFETIVLRVEVDAEGHSVEHILPSGFIHSDLTSCLDRRGFPNASTNLDGTTASFEDAEAAVQGVPLVIACAAEQAWRLQP